MAITLIKKIQDVTTRVIFGKEKTVMKKAFYELIDRDMNGKEVSMSSFQNKVLLVTNVASK